MTRAICRCGVQDVAHSDIAWRHGDWVYVHALQVDCYGYRVGGAA